MLSPTSLQNMEVYWDSDKEDEIDTSTSHISIEQDVMINLNTAWSSNEEFDEFDLCEKTMLCPTEDPQKPKSVINTAAVWGSFASTWCEWNRCIPIKKRLVVKIECTNHVIKNYGKRRYAKKNDTKNVSFMARKLLPYKRILELQKIAQKAIYDNVHGNVATLKRNLENEPYHVFQHHTDCVHYYCSTPGNIDSSQLDTARFSELFRLIQGHLWHTSPRKKAVKQSPGKYFKKFMTRQKKYKRKLHFGYTSKQRPKPLNHKAACNVVDDPIALEKELTAEELAEECNRKLKTLIYTFQPVKEEDVEEMDEEDVHATTNSLHPLPELPVPLKRKLQNANKNTVLTGLPNKDEVIAA
ncbi:hypothetical protein ILUMI_27245 [Ignelater luminosus]|uniref:Mutator-like transposase domain-containing protein n=1 Tax=Ignelater luminosus TaxID=2038154 RepID=A0A8K0C5D6_IGNLU|nr:hypothetical protein ILUMI_27245 [Ignelater luminosus]